MPNTDLERLRSIKTLASLVVYLRDELDWPIESDDIEDISFDYTSAELGIAAEAAVRIKEIKQLRPLNGNQPWGIFWVNFEKKRLPVVVMRLILRALVLKKRASSGQAERQAWAAHDLLFISAYGEETDRAVSFAHFVENPGNNLAELRVLGWDDDDTPLHMDYVARMLHEKLRWDDKLAAHPDAWRQQWSDAFLLRHRHVVRTSQELATALAKLARSIRSRISTVLRSEDGFGEMRKLQRAFRVGLIHDLDDAGFADMFAQTVTYGLFSLACRRTVPGEGTAFAKDDLPHYFTSPFLKEMLGVFLGLKSRKGAIDFDELGVSDVTDLLTSPDTHMEVVLADFNNKTRGEDPVIHFYEHFLSAYNKVQKIQRGVFYTPQPAVSYIVRGAHELLQTEFGLEDGLASIVTWGEMMQRNPGIKLPPLTDEPGEKRTIDPAEFFVQILDVATGTATFFVEVVDVIHKTMVAKWKKQGLKAAQIEAAWNEYVPKHLLPRVYGYELMMAPYAIAHMKVGLKLSETGYLFATEVPVRIYLTNTLEPKVTQLPQIGFDALAHEAKAVNEIKWYKRFTVVIGNPPYAGHSANNSPWIESLVDEYFQIDGTPLNEANSKWLRDDYVKFTRFGQEMMRRSGVGVFSFITNHGYIDNPTFRGMRFSMLADFRRFWVTDLHGNMKKKERDDAGEHDENVFDIQQGVAVFAGVFGHSATSEVWHGHIRGDRGSKYARLQKEISPRLALVPVHPAPPFYLLVPQDVSTRDEYDGFLNIAAEAQESSLGILTKRDSLAIAFSSDELLGALRRFADRSRTDAEVAAEFGVPLADKDKWNVTAARASLSRVYERNVRPILYRPFDVRFVYYDDTLVARTNRRVLKHLEQVRGNRGFIFGRQGMATGSETWDVCFVCAGLADQNIYRRGGGTVFPLHLSKDEHGFGLGDSRLNFSRNLTKHFTNFAAKPDDIFHYAYAVFHSPGYRSRFAEFLKIDFPRLPLTGNPELFRALAQLGGALTALHLLESPKLAPPITEFIGRRNPEVEKISWSRNTVWVDKAQTTGFKGVREDLWNFHIGGYQVCEKWLKDRKGRTLTKEDLAHYHKIVIALAETIRLMSEIDAVIAEHGGWPIE